VAESKAEAHFPGRVARLLARMRCGLILVVKCLLRPVPVSVNKFSKFY
jgi:hypothetical protein